MERVSSILKSQAFKYLFVGGVSFVFEISLLYLLGHVLSINTTLSVTISFWVGLVFSFIAQRVVTFRDTSKSVRRISQQSVQYGLLVFVNFSFTLAFVTLTESLLGLLVARTVALIITTFWNYYVYKKVIFTNNTSDNKTSSKNSLNSISLKLLLKSEPFLLSIAVIPIIVFCLPMLSTGSTLFPGDFDMQVQMTEAAKISIKEYGQFPLWNPWISGGVPLFADPQFGLITPQTLLSLVLNSAVAWKLTIALYLLVGFLSLYTLLKHVTRSTHTGILIFISYLWIFGSFFSLRSAGGHFTFLVLSLLPLAIFCLLRSVESKKYVIGLALIIAYCLNASLHYSTILTLLTLGFIALFLTAYSLVSALRSRRHSISWKSIGRTFSPLIALCVATVIGFVLTAARVIPTLAYLDTNSVERTGARESFIGLGEGLRSLFLPYGTYRSNEVLMYGQFEASNYIGTITAVAIVAFAMVLFIYSLRQHTTSSVFGGRRAILTAVIGVGALFFLIGLAGSPFELFRTLPVISSMRVSTRFFTVVSLCLLIVLAIFATTILQKRALGKYTRLFVYSLVLLASVQVYMVGFNFQKSTWLDTKSLLQVYSNQSTHASIPHSDIEWRDQESKVPYYHALTAATVAQRAQIVADNALVDTRSVPTQRCDEDNSTCHFVLTNNAKVEYWSPNKITLRRVGVGEIKININQAKGWQVNGIQAFPTQKIVESDSTFVINDSNASAYTLTYALF